MKSICRSQSVGLFGLLLLAACGRYEVGSTDRDPVAVPPPVVAATPEKPFPAVEPETNLPCGGPWGVCWEYPKLTAENVVGVTAAPGSKEAWAITEGGSILKFDGTDWSTAVTQRFPMLGMAITAPTGNDILAVAARTTAAQLKPGLSSELYEMRFNGATWRETASYGTVPYAVFKVNDGEESLPPPTFQKPNGTFEELSFVAFERSAAGVVAMATDGRVFRASNRTWVEERLGLPESNGDPARFVACGLYRHRDGTIDAVIEEQRTQAETVIYVQSMRQAQWVNTATWQSPFRTVDQRIDRYGHRGHSVAFFAGSLYVASRVTGDLVRFSGGKGELVDSQARLAGLAVAGDSLIGVGPEGRVVELDGPRGRIVHNPRTSTRRVKQLMATSRDSVIGVLSLGSQDADEARSRLFRYSDGKRTIIPGPTMSRESTGPNGTVIVESPIPVVGFSALSENDIWVTSRGGYDPISHWDGTRWSNVVVPETRQVLAVWERAKEDVWAVAVRVNARETAGA